MGARAKTQAQRTRDDRDILDSLLEACVAMRQAELETTPPGGKFTSIRAICKIVQTKYELESGNKLAKDLSKSTVDRLLKGGTRKSDSNADRGWLLAEEEVIVADFCLQCANRGFPLSHRRLKEHVDMICRARLGNQFPETGVGKQWTDRFITRHSDALKTFWTHPLDDKRGRAVNPTNNTAWFDLLEEVLAGRKDYELDSADFEGATDFVPIRPENIYGTDETGFYESTSVKHKVIGPKKRKTQHQQGGGGRENTTVIVTICADGTSVKPVVIFKGKYFQVNWNQENPTEAS
jgi:hypothetical protein